MQSPTTVSSLGVAMLTVADQDAAGDWTVIHDYGGRAGVTFQQHFELAKTRGRSERLPLRGGKVKVPIRVQVHSTAEGTLINSVGGQPQVENYRCTAETTRTVKATVRLSRHGRRFKLTTVTMKELPVGDATCTGNGFVEFPSDTSLFDRELTSRASPSAKSLFDPVALGGPEAQADCGDPALVGTCTERLKWAGTLLLRRAR